MRILVQRVRDARVTIAEDIVAAMGKGLLVFLGIARTDATADADYLLGKLLGLRIFPDDAGKMNLDVSEAGGSLLIVSQFTLYGDCRRGRRPSFDRAAPPERALTLYNYFVESVAKSQVSVESGVFQAHMQVTLSNDGPVTILIDSGERNQR